MAFNYTLIKTDTLEEGDRQYWGYNLSGGAGMVLNIRLRFAIPGATPPPMKGLEKELYLPGDTVAGMSGISWTELKSEAIGNGITRYEHAYQTPGGNVLLRMLTKATMKVDRITRTFYIDEIYTVIENGTITGTDVSKGSSRKGSISTTGSATYAGAASPAWQDLVVVGAGASLQLTVVAEAGDDIEANLVFSAYNSINTSYSVDVRIVLDSTEVAWCRNRFNVSTGDDHNFSIRGCLVGLTAGTYTLKGQIWVPGEFNQVTHYYGTARGKLEYRLIRA